MMWSVSLLNAALSCAFVRLNSCGTLDMHHMSKLVTSACFTIKYRTRGAPDMHHTNKLVTSASSLYDRNYYVTISLIG